MKWIDILLDHTTMYRLVFYELIFLLLGAGVLGFFGVLPHTPILLAFSVVYIFFIAWITNALFAWAFDAPTNPESTYITALILALIITPATTFFDPIFFSLAGWAAALAIASKYLLAINKKHLFNPAAFGIAVTAIVLNQGASWWVGTASMLPFVLIGGYLVVKKMQRFDLLWSFIIVALALILGDAVLVGSDIFSAFNSIVLSAPLFFFATVMLTEPMTTPPSRIRRILYGAVVAVLFMPFFHIGWLYSTPELALLAGNLVAYLMSSKRKLVLRLKQRIRLTPNTYDFVFTPDQPLSFEPGQYLEWTLPHAHTDSRGIRRYFTIASSPKEPDLHLGVKFNPNGSSFKKKLLELRAGDTIVASQLAGDFVLPADTKKKLVCIAGGIGITPFRSMIQSMLDTNEKRDVTLIYVNKTPADVAYHHIFSRAEEEIGLKTVYSFTDPGIVLAGVPGAVGRIDAAVLRRQVPDSNERIFYLSGPQAMVDGFTRILEDIGIPKRHIRTDFFPGFA